MICPCEGNMNVKHFSKINQISFTLCFHLLDSYKGIPVTYVLFRGHSQLSTFSQAYKPYTRGGGGK